MTYLVFYHVYPYLHECFDLILYDSIFLLQWTIVQTNSNSEPKSSPQFAALLMQYLACNLKARVVTQFT